MRKLLLLLMINYLSISNAQVLNEDFEGGVFPPTGWTTDNTNPSRPWGLTTTIFDGDANLQNTYNINGTSAAIDWIAANNDANLISPTFSLVGYSSANFNFNVIVGWSYMINQDLGDLVAKVSNDGGTTWTQVWSEDTETGFTDDNDNNPDSDLYNTVAVTIDMTSYLGQSNLKVKFQYTGNDADAVSIDDIVVDGNLSSNTFFTSNFISYPNPVSSNLSINNLNNNVINSITISDLNGRTIENIKYNNMDLANFEINTSNLNSGIYILRIDSQEGIATKKIIKR
ncbi:hypothetical protein SY27_14145 [Flavobacterium sp. 316]|uniref:T9SS type A sorting domain-containing protein n=1 Tax=Flavobacterium sp. 316 TaxID=1603293 RepID=UPI0005E97907|nr:T9SS type A sorting domain-containing protein [Flavobacterium sp. 316]KIX20268.1 hypothetical protein SY27_14145 [Flavobacterium sp. 316]